LLFYQIIKMGRGRLMSGFLRLCASALRQAASASHGVARGAAK